MGGMHIWEAMVLFLATGGNQLVHIAIVWFCIFSFPGQRRVRVAEQQYAFCYENWKKIPIQNLEEDTTTVGEQADGWNTECGHWRLGVWIKWQSVWQRVLSSPRACSPEYCSDWADPSLKKGSSKTFIKVAADRSLFFCVIRLYT